MSEKILKITGQNKSQTCVFDNWDKHFGAHFDNAGNAMFKLFTFYDVESAELEYKPRGLEAETVRMFKTADCFWEIKLPKGIIKSGDRYRFWIERNVKKYSVKDPCSMWQDSFFKWSRIYNHSLFQWSDDIFLNGNTGKKISRNACDDNKFLPVGALRIYEIHIGTLTEEGTFKSAKDFLKYIAKDLKFNAIEIMPVENTYSFNWGYDGVDKYAPNHTYGTPDDLKDFINEAHKNNLNVIMDIVPNHLGPDIQQLSQTGPYIEGTNCFGYKFNFEYDKYAPYVRDFIIGAALNWIVNYHCDGLRVDMTKFMCSDYTMKELAAEINYHTPDAFLIAEDGRDNDNRIIRLFSPSERDKNETEHIKFINEIKNNNVSLSGIGFDTEWDFPFHKQIAATVLGAWDCREKNICNFDAALKEAQYRVKYPMSHDEIGNVDGTRLISKIIVNKLNLKNAVCNCLPDNKCKVAAQAAHKVITAFVEGKLEKMSEQERIEFYKQNNIDKNIEIEDFYKAYIDAVNMHKLVLAKIFSVPGPKMVFQGDDSGNLSYFKFFRKFSSGPEPYLREKGYEPGLAAFLDSKLSSVNVSSKYAYLNSGIEKLTSDLNRLCDNNISLADGHIEKTVVHENSDIHAIHTRKMYNEIFSVSNFSDVPYRNSYGIMFPKGRWREILNTDYTHYAGKNECINTGKIFENFSYISISPYGCVFFEKVS